MFIYLFHLLSITLAEASIPMLNWSGGESQHPISNLHSHQQCSLFSTLSPAFTICRLVNDGHSDSPEVIPHCSFDLHFSNHEWCWASFHVREGHLYVFFGELCYLYLPPIVLIGLFDFGGILSCRSCLYILEINPLSVASLAIIFSHSEVCHCIWFMVSCAVQDLLSLIRSHLFSHFFFLLM